jgi:hypothetical protein
LPAITVLWDLEPILWAIGMADEQSVQSNVFLPESQDLTLPEPTGICNQVSLIGPFILPFQGKDFIGFFYLIKQTSIFENPHYSVGILLGKIHGFDFINNVRDGHYRFDGTGQHPGCSHVTVCLASVFCGENFSCRGINNAKEPVTATLFKVEIFPVYMLSPPGQKNGFCHFLDFLPGTKVLQITSATPCIPVSCGKCASPSRSR